MVNLTEFSTDEEVDVELFGKVVRRVVLQNPNLRFFLSEVGLLKF